MIIYSKNALKIYVSLTSIKGNMMSSTITFPSIPRYQFNLYSTFEWLLLISKV